MSTKVPLDLTVEEKFKLLARELAKKRQLSVSELFEDLVAEEIRRTRKQAEPKKTKCLETITARMRELRGHAALTIAGVISMIDWRWWLGIAVVGALMVDATDGKLDLFGGFRLW